MKDAMRMYLLFRAATLVVLVGCASPAATPPVATKSTGKLSARLEVLTRSPGLHAASADEQARALSLPAQGPGSLLRDTQGRILVNIRTTDLSTNGLQTLRDSDAVITSVSKQYQAVTAFVAIASLSVIANLPAVQSVEEELAPGTGGGAMFPPTP